MTKRRLKSFRNLLAVTMLSVTLLGCADASVPGGRNLNIPTPNQAEQRKEAVNERPDSVMYLPLGKDVLVPEMSTDDPLPNDIVGPFELRSETLAGALQLILADYEVPLAFETEEGLTRRITVANLSGPISKVVQNVCGLADLYCSFENGLLVVKDKQTFTVKIPPISQDTAFMQNVATGLQAVLGEGATVTVDPSTRTLVYRASQRSAEIAERYFQRMRSSTALIVFETYIWEVALDSGNSAGIKWNALDTFGKFAANIDLSGSVGADFTNPISIGLPTTQGADGGTFSPTKILDFLSTFGAVKTISQPQITVLSGSEAKLRAADTQNYVAEVSETIDDGLSRTSVNTSSIDTGFTLTIASAWDNATVYADVEIVLTDVSEIEDFDFQSGDGGSTTVQLPKSTERELTTQIRVRPGDSVLIAGLVRESDAYDKQGIGFMKPFIPTSRTVTTRNLELVFLLRPRVIVYTSPKEGEHHNAIRAYGEKSPEVSHVSDAANVSYVTPYEGQNIPAHVAATPLPAPVQAEPVPAGASGNPVPLGSVSPDLMDPSGG
ncbi:MAG: type II secretion system protein GspD [Micavibrio sp.]